MQNPADQSRQSTGLPFLGANSVWAPFRLFSLLDWWSPHRASFSGGQLSPGLFQTILLALQWTPHTPQGSHCSRSLSLVLFQQTLHRASFSEWQFSLVLFQQPLQRASYSEWPFSMVIFQKTLHRASFSGGQFSMGPFQTILLAFRGLPTGLPFLGSIFQTREHFSDQVFARGGGGWLS